MQIMYELYSKSTIPSKHYYIQPFPVKLHKTPFLYSSKLLLSQWGSEVWKHQFQVTERSLAVCSRYCHRWHFLQSHSKNVRTSRHRRS